MSGTYTRVSIAVLALCLLVGCAGSGMLTQTRTSSINETSAASSTVSPATLGTVVVDAHFSPVSRVRALTGGLPLETVTVVVYLLDRDSGAPLVAPMRQAHTTAASTQTLTLASVPAGTFNIVVEGDDINGVPLGFFSDMVSVVGGGISTVTVLTSSALSAVTVVPATASIALGTTQPFEADARFESSAPVIVSGVAAWSSDATAVASIDSAGLARALSPGSATIRAAFGGQAGTASLAVKGADVVLTAIAVAPANATLRVGAQQAYEADGTFSDGSVQTLGNVTWRVSNPTVASISTSGLLNALAAGSAQVSASSGAITGATSLTVAAGPTASPSPAASPSPSPGVSPSPSPGVSPSPSPGASPSPSPGVSPSPSPSPSSSPSPSPSPQTPLFHLQPVGAPLGNVTFGAGKFVTVGDSVAWVSADGIHWTAAGVGSASSTMSIAYGNGLFVASGFQGGNLSSSPDGLTWTRRVSGLTSPGNISFANGVFFVTGFSNGVMLTSTDGINFSTVNTAVNDTWNGVAFGAGKWVAIGSNGSLATSLDAATWTQHAAAPLLSGLAITFGNGQFVVVGSDVDGTFHSIAALATSPDGITFTRRAPADLGFLLGAGVVGSTFVAVGASSTTNTGLAYSSTDGVNWTLNPLGFFQGAGLAYDGTSTVVATGPGGTSTSTDGVTWTARTTTMGFASGIVFDGSRFVVSTRSSNNGAIRTSPDGLLWTSRLDQNAGGLNAVTSANGTSVAVGDDSLVGGNGPVLFTSSDGVNWVDRAPLPGVTNQAAVTYGNGLYVSVGSNSATLSSSDGATWAFHSVTAGNSLTGVAYGNGSYVAVGTSGHIFTSTDAVSWTLRASGVASTLRAVAYGASTFTAVGDGGVILTSPDGTTWTQQSSGTSLALMSAAFVNNTFFAGGTSLILNSNNGVNWTSCDLGLVTTLVIDGFSFGGGRVVAVTSRGYVYTAP